MKRPSVKLTEGRGRADDPPLVRAVTPEGDGGFTASDLVLQMAVNLAFDTPPDADFSAVSFEYEVVGADADTQALVNTVLRAVHEKHLWSRNVYKPRKVREIARELVVDVLVGKQNWGRYASIFARCAERNDREFFERLVRGIQRKRKPVFDKVEWFCLLNWHDWSYCPTLPHPPLKYWTGEAALDLLHTVTDLAEDSLRIRGVTGLYTKWKRLGLVQEKPARVTGMLRE